MSDNVKYLAEVWLRRDSADDEMSEADPFDSVSETFASLVAARLWAGRMAKQLPRAIGAASVHRYDAETGETDGEYAYLGGAR